MDQLTKRYGSPVAVHDVSFSVERGEIFALLGPDGSGKTSVVECLQGLRVRDGGGCACSGADPQREPAKLRHRLGRQLQDSACPIRVGEALELFASLAPGSVDWRLLLDQWGLTAQRRTPCASLSGGQRQRLFVALALVSEPEVVFLEELTQGSGPGGPAARRGPDPGDPRTREHGRAGRRPTGCGSDGAQTRAGARSRD
ncbi:MAG: ATP-binding cassette domain-containing protein [Actinobacteria bacterium]|nr:ATP-binding cassette domain-containing protein [Actinomycetota bacterium]MBW3646168.1 ATP-binding cassette domain-containing protein [Actinomycetota bacterium]